MKTNHHYARILLAAGLLSAAVIPIQADTIVWTNTAGGLWSDALNWEPNQVPVSSDIVRITNSGTYVVTLDVDATVNRLILGTSIGHPMLTNSGYTFTLNNTSAVGTNGILNMSGGALAGSGLLTVRGEFNWSGGAVYGALTVETTGVLNLSGDADKELYEVLTNAGRINWTHAGNLNLYHHSAPGYGTAAIYNLAGAVFDAQNDQTLNDYWAAGLALFSNAGALRKSVGLGTTHIQTPCLNTGTVDVQSGTVRFERGGEVGGSYVMATGAVIDLAGRDFTQSGNPQFTGAGQSRFTGGTLTLTSDVIPNLPLVGGTVLLAPSFQDGSITNLTLAGSTLGGTNTVSGTFNCGGGVSGSLLVAGGATVNWTGGAVSGALTVASNGVLNLSGDADKELYEVLTNAGRINWTHAGNLNLYHHSAPGYGTAAIYNLAGAVFDAQNDQTLNDYWAAGLALFSNAGALRKSVGLGTTHIQTPCLNTGTVDAQSGTVRFERGYSNSTSANLAISLGGAAPGSGYGQIQFSSPPTFAGAFTVSTRNGYQPNPGDTFTVLTYPSAPSAFSCMSGLDLGDGLRLQPKFTATSFTLTAVAYATNAVPQLFISPSPGLVTVSWPLGFPDWTLETCANLTSPSWAPVSQACGNAALLPIIPPQQFFRLNNNSSTNWNAVTNWNALTNWTETSAPSTNWRSVASSADGTKLVAVVGGGGICTSTNSGVAWNQATAPIEDWASVASSADGARLVAAVRGGGIYISSNLGDTWTQSSAPSATWSSVASSVDGTRLAAAIRDGGIYTSTNSGATWTQASAPNSGWSSIACSADGTKSVAACDWWGGGGIYTSTDSGATWTRAYERYDDWRSVASSADGTKLVAVVCGGGFCTSTDSGTTWTYALPTDEWQSVASSADGTILAAGSTTLSSGGGRICISTNSGTTWVQTSAPNQWWDSIASSADGAKLVAVGNGGGIWTAQATIQTTTAPRPAGSHTGD